MPYTGSEDYSLREVGLHCVAYCSAASQELNAQYTLTAEWPISQLQQGSVLLTTLKHKGWPNTYDWIGYEGMFWEEVRVSAIETADCAAGDDV